MVLGHRPTEQKDERGVGVRGWGGRWKDGGQAGEEDRIKGRSKWNTKKLVPITFMGNHYCHNVTRYSSKGLLGDIQQTSWICSGHAVKMCCNLSVKCLLHITFEWLMGCKSGIFHSMNTIHMSHLDAHNKKLTWFSQGNLDLPLTAQTIWTKCNFCNKVKLLCPRFFFDRHYIDVCICAIGCVSYALRVKWGEIGQCIQPLPCAECAQSSKALSSEWLLL